MTKPFLSLCMIVRDASETIDALLESIDGYFDELVFIDTGSKDGTYESLCQFHENTYGIDDRGVVMLFRRAWQHDFAFHRNEAFNLATGKWRMYLDADDVLINGEKLRAELHALEEKYPQANGISLPYIYRENDTEQEVLRVVRWDDGWKWSDPVHEFLECETGRRRVTITGIQVKHNKTFEAGVEAVGRNAKIALECYECTEDKLQRARMAAYLAADCMVRGFYADAGRFWEEAIAKYNSEPFAIVAYEDYIRMCLSIKDTEKALRLASELAGRNPESGAGTQALTVVHAARRDWARAALSYEESCTKLPPQTIVLDTVWWSKGFVPLKAAQAFVHLGNAQRALEILGKVPEGIRLHPEVRQPMAEVQGKAMRLFGENLACQWQDFLLWTNEPNLARAVTLPPVLASSQKLNMRHRAISKRMKHTHSTPAYNAAYAAIPADVYHTDNHMRDQVLELARARILFNYVESLPKTPLMQTRVLSVGFQDGIIEQEMLARCPGMHLCVADVAPQAAQGFEELAARFPGRVSRHVVQEVYDIAPDQRWFDIVICFEVIEHVPSVYKFMVSLVDVLRDDGKLFLSTPNSERWIETKHGVLGGVDPEPYWHVRSFTHGALYHQLRQVHLKDVVILAAEDNTYVVTATKGDRAYATAPALEHAVAIYVPGTPSPFDALSPERGFLGGSEEAVVRLASALMRAGHDVVVYAPTLEREDHCQLRAYDDVLWCDPSEYSPMYHGTTLYWRCPEVMEWDLMQGIDHKKYLWLHDASYEVGPSTFQKADRVLALSIAHCWALERNTGFHPNNVISNGIEPEHFPVLTVANEVLRDPHRVIYASSPERGLEVLLDQWEYIRTKVPDASLHVYYDWEPYKKANPEAYEKLWGKLNRLSGIPAMEVYFHGGVSQPELHDAFRQAGVWAYPNIGDVETFCITALKAQASGCIPVASDAGALREVICDSVELFDENRLLDGDSRGFADTLVGVLAASSPESRADQRVELRRWVLENYTWDHVAKRIGELMDEDEAARLQGHSR